MGKFDGKTAVVTGASRGIGRAIAKKLAACGATVIINYNGSESKAAAVQQEIIDEGGRADIFQCNVSDFAACEAFFKAVTEKYGRIDFLINNAGITKDGLLMAMKDEDFDRVLGINLRGAFLCLREAAKIMSKQRYGRIINISSVVGQMGNAGQVNYSAAKAGLIGMTKSAAKELASRSITVNAVAPGFIETDMTAALSDEARDAYAKAIPLGRLGSAQDVADAVAFLASDKASYITGQILAVNGGLYC